MCTGLSVSQGMVVIGQVIATRSRHCMKLVIRQTITEMLAGCSQRIVGLLIRIVHLVDTEYLFQASFVEWAIVRHKRQALDLRCNLLPDVWKYRGVFSILLRKAVDLLAKPLIVFRFRVDQTVK